MKPTPCRRPASRDPALVIARLRARLAESVATLQAVRTGQVDAVVVAGKTGPRVFTLEGADHPYRVLIESMNEGALTLSPDASILYANQRFARMVRRPLELVAGGSFFRFLAAEEQPVIRALLQRSRKSGAKIQSRLNAGDNTRLPVQISFQPLPKGGSNRATIGLVVTDMTEARRSEQMLRALTHRVVVVQEAERGRVALELHDHITQLLCGVLVRCHTLENRLPARGKFARAEAARLRLMLGETVDEVERISRNLRPGLLEHLGLVEVLRVTGDEFALRTGVSLHLDCAPLSSRLPPAIELALYRIVQEALKNVEFHARARNASLLLKKSGDSVWLKVKDDGVGFDPEARPTGPEANEGLGLLGMRERATYAGGVLTLSSARDSGTKIEVLIPLPLEAAGVAAERTVPRRRPPVPIRPSKPPPAKSE